MDAARLAELLARAGVADVDPGKLARALEMVEDPDDFYYDAEGLRSAGSLGDLRSLTTVDSGVFRRLLGI